MTLLRSLARKLAAAQTPAEPPAQIVARAAPTINPAAVAPPLSGLRDPALPADWLKRALDQQDNAPQTSRTGHTGYTHVSTLARAVCVREYALAARYGRQASEAVTGGHRLLWAYGRTAENHIRDQAIAAFNGAVYGRWKCACGSVEHVGTRPSSTCGRCGKPVNRYREEPVFNHEYRIVGNPDLPIMVNRTHMAVVEIKSLPGDEWRELEAPKSEHITQGLMYGWLKRQNGFTVHDDIVFIYASRNFRWGSPYKQYAVSLSSEESQSRLALALEAASAIRDAHASPDIIPPRAPACTSPDVTRARNCAQCALCFNLPE